MKQILIIDCAGLDIGVAGQLRLPLEFQPLEPVFPAVTCTAQATMRTGLTPREHGVVCNGRYMRDVCRVEFWGQSARVMPQKRIWDGVGTSCVMFHQQSLGDSADYVLSPAPIHKHHGGMIQACHTRPREMEKVVYDAVGECFRLSQYWGPLASAQVGEWCAKSTVAVMERYAPDVVMTYLPDMDYVLQREGPSGPHVSHEIKLLKKHIMYLLDKATKMDYAVVVWGDYGISTVGQVVYPNRALLSAGLFEVRDVNGHFYPNLYDSKAFAMTDHQVAHVYIQDTAKIDAVRTLLSLPGVDVVQTPREAGLEHPNSGELILIANKDAWFSYQWWEDARNAPDYANHIDIHSKIGFDPCELFWSVPFLRTSTDCSKVHGSHGRADIPAAFAVTDDISHLRKCTSLVSLAQQISGMMVANSPQNAQNAQNDQ